MLLRYIVAAGLCSAVFVSPALANRDRDLDVRAMYQRKLDANNPSTSATSKNGGVDRKNTSSKRTQTKPAASRASSARPQAVQQRATPASTLPTSNVAVEGNNGELRSSDRPRGGFFKTMFGEDAPRYLPETLTLDNKLAERAGKRPFQVRPDFVPQSVPFSGYDKGTIVIDTGARYLYLVESRDTARRYAIAVGKEGLAFKGATTVGDKQEWPRWFPTKDMQQREPKKYGQYKEGMNGGPDNPLGARAIYLYQGKTDTHIRIHGTNQPQSIGSAASNGCFRMINDHVMDLYRRVPMGTQVVVL